MNRSGTVSCIIVSTLVSYVVFDIIFMSFVHINANHLRVNNGGPHVHVLIDASQDFGIHVIISLYSCPPPRVIQNPVKFHHHVYDDGQNGMATSNLVCRGCLEVTLILTRPRGFTQKFVFLFLRRTCSRLHICVVQSGF